MHYHKQQYAQVVVAHCPLETLHESQNLSTAWHDIGVEHHSLGKSEELAQKNDIKNRNA